VNNGSTIGHIVDLDYDNCSAVLFILYSVKVKHRFKEQLTLYDHSTVTMYITHNVS